MHIATYIYTYSCISEHAENSSSKHSKEIRNFYLNAESRRQGKGKVYAVYMKGNLIAS